MIWILHIAAALIFWPALFVTIPAHLILNRVPKPEGPQLTAEEHAEAARGKAQITATLTLACIAVYFLVSWGVL